MAGESERLRAPGEPAQSFGTFDGVTEKSGASASSGSEDSEHAFVEDTLSLDANTDAELEVEIVRVSACAA